MMYRIPVSTSGARAMLAAAAIVGTAACASHPPVTAESPTRTAQSSRYVLVATDIERAKSDNVYDAIAKLRPEFLRGHSDVTSFVNQQIPTSSKDPGAAATPPGTATAAVQSVPPVIAYRDKTRLSSVDDLKQMSIAGIAEIRYIPGPEAGVKYGTNHSGGVILVKSK